MNLERADQSLRLELKGGAVSCDDCDKSRKGPGNGWRYHLVDGASMYFLCRDCVLKHHFHEFVKWTITNELSKSTEAP